MVQAVQPRMKKQPELIQEIDGILALVPTEQQINISLRYGNGPEELKGIIASLRDRLGELKTKLEQSR